jgi:hypothetical protein
MGDQHSSMTRGLLIITADHLPSARALAEAAPFSLPPEQAAQLFVPAGSADGTAPASHYWASGLFTDDQWVALQQLETALPWAQTHEYDLATSPAFPWVLLTALGLQPLTPQTP